MVGAPLKPGLGLSGSSIAGRIAFRFGELGTLAAAITYQLKLVEWPLPGPFLEGALKINLLDRLVCAFSATIRSLRTNFRAASTISCLTALGLSCTPAAAQDVRIEHVIVVSPERSLPMRDATVYIHDDRIASISPARSVEARRSKTNARSSTGTVFISLRG